MSAAPPSAGKGRSRGAMSPRGILAFAALAAVTLLCAWPALDSSFTYDEQAGIVENRAVRPGAPIAAPLGYRFSPDQMRPVFFLSLWLNARISGVEPFPFRLSNVLLHLACGLLVGLLLARAGDAGAGAGDAAGWELARSPAGPAALAGTALFLLHPLQSESVFYVWGRSGILSTAGLLGALLLALAAAGARGGGARAAFWCGAIAAETLALLSKEEAIVLPLIFFIWWTLAEGRRAPEGLRRAAVLAAPVALFLAARVALLGAAGRQVYARGHVDNVLGQAVVTLRTIRLILFPSGQSIDPDARVPPLAIGLAAAGACAALVLLAVLLAREVDPGGGARRSAMPARLVACGVLTGAAGVLIYWLVPLPDLMSERRAYLPMLGASIVLAGLLHALPRRSRSPSVAGRPAAPSRGGRILVLLAAPVLALLLAPALYARAAVWSEPRRLWEEAARRAPDRTRPYINLGVFAAERGDMDAAAAFFDRALELDPSHPEALFNRARMRMDAGDLEGARADLEAAVATDPGMLRARINLGIVFIRLGDLANAEGILRDVLAIDPGEPRTLTNLAEVLRATGRASESKVLYLEALASDPSYAHAAARLGVALEDEGDLEGALAAYRGYLARGPATAGDRSAVLEKIADIERRLAAPPGAAADPR